LKLSQLALPSLAANSRCSVTAAYSIPYLFAADVALQWDFTLGIKVARKFDTVLTVKHILLDCPELRDIRLKYFTVSSLKDIFESVDHQNIIGFIKDAHCLPAVSQHSYP